MKCEIYISQVFIVNTNSKRAGLELPALQLDLFLLSRVKKFVLHLYGSLPIRISVLSIEYCHFYHNFKFYFSFSLCESGPDLLLSQHPVTWCNSKPKHLDCELNTRFYYISIKWLFLLWISLLRIITTFLSNHPLNHGIDFVTFCEHVKPQGTINVHGYFMLHEKLLRCVSLISVIAH